MTTAGNMVMLGVKPIPPTPPLPYDAEVEYLESTGTQWIDTRVYGASNRGTDIDFAVTSIQSEKGIFGCLGLPRQCIILAGDRFRYDLGSGSTYRYAQTTARRVVSYDPSSHVVTDSVYGVVGWDDSPLEFSDTPDTMTIFVDKRDGAIVSASRITSMRLYGFRAWDSSGDLLDLIPVRLTNELGQSEGAMYDRMSGQLFRNQGTGAFLYGQDIPHYDIAYYVESNGTQYIDTGIKQAGDLEIGAVLMPSYSTYDESILGWGYQVYFGCGYNDNSKYNIICRAQYRHLDSVIFWYANSISAIYAAEANFSTTSWNYISMDSSSVTVNGKQQNYTSSYNPDTINTDLSIYLFAGNKPDENPWRPMHCKIKNFWVKKNGELIQNLIPVKIDGNGFMYDTVTKKLMTTLGTEQLKAGPKTGERI